MLTGFKAEFVNLNQSLRDRYSNYYVDTMPLLADNDISFTLYHINFDNIVDLLEAISQAILGITVRVNIAYEVKFKGLQARANIEALVVITNDLVALDNIQDNIEKYFTNFVHNTFQKENYKIVWNRYHNNITEKQVILPIIQKVLKNKNILFF
ncbi:hypothetical protein [Spiroplasma phoeniceum]|uniref:Uncharacterized protein n=1 Tax=Spiroplasma phoeniceum P40 TaxID=1276259 RepID=A0A345DQJ8_9MOLU|nr:hypothetical protein [Spiroplasma phoeniceum]AXF96489.1 hypothetical protein SDAV_001524 [Spiroplasma phoeniceum P40]